MRRDINAFGRLRQALVHIQIRNLSAAVLDAHSTVSAGVYMSMDTRATRASSSNLSTQLRPANTRNAWSLPVPLPIVDLT